MSNYESRAYLTLLSTGIRTAKEIANESKIPFGRVYDVLSSLEDKGLADKQESRPKKFVAKEPKIALNNLLNLKTAELQTLTIKAAVIEEKLSNLHTTKPEDTLFWSVALGEKAISRYIEKISETEKELQTILNIRVAARIPQKEIIENLITTLKLLTENGVSVQILLSGVTPGSLEETFLASVAHFFVLLDRAEVKRTQLTPTAFDIIDDEKILLKVMNPVNPDEFFAWIFVWQKKLAINLKPKFQELWKDATDLKIEIS
ncbi:MAG: TrmB family transcriptional regulator [Candidatus Heimdallarchaeota archaeon]|nr:MAG: TrmB family transcriptional regulator [Candidatus Heimdallarchaeota archaeon]